MIIIEQNPQKSHVSHVRFNFTWYFCLLCRFSFSISFTLDKQQFNIIISLCPKFTVECFGFCLFELLSLKPETSKPPGLPFIWIQTLIISFFLAMKASIYLFVYVHWIINNNYRPSALRFFFFNSHLPPFFWRKLQNKIQTKRKNQINF